MIVCVAISLRQVGPSRPPERAPVLNWSSNGTLDFGVPVTAGPYYLLKHKRDQEHYCGT